MKATSSIHAISVMIAPLIAGVPLLFGATLSPAQQDGAAPAKRINDNGRLHSGRRVP
jgi:hypothetical protein